MIYLQRIMTILLSYIVECLNGRYGKNCAFQCSTNCDLLTCDKTNGSCECKLGYKPPLCEQKILQRQGKFDLLYSGNI